MECWSDGVMEYWSVGVMEYWRAGVVELLDFGFQIVDFGFVSVLIKRIIMI